MKNFSSFWGTFNPRAGHRDGFRIFKQIALLIIIFCTFGMQTNTSFAVDCGEKGCVTIRVTEDIPGANCKYVEGSGEDSEGNTKDKHGNEIPKLYDCEVPKGTQAITSMLGAILKYFTYIASLVGVLFIVYNGILYSMGGLDEALKTNAKKMIIWTLAGLALLFLAGPLLQFIAPWVYK